MDFLYEEEQLVDECLNGERDRECEDCPAHSSRGGRCCFALRHEHGDPHCTVCQLEPDCSYLTHGYGKSDARSSSRIVYPGRPSANRPQPRRVRSTQTKKGKAREFDGVGPQFGDPLLVQRPADPQPLQLNPKDNLFTRFLKVGSWGAGEGFFEMGLNFFRKRRPE